MSEKITLEFPEGFLWGASTSAHQVEGGNINDWSEWEKKNAERLAHEAKDKYAKWQQKKFPEMFDPKNYVSGQTADHYNKYEEDFDIAKSLGHNAHRLSIEWSRIEPEEGKFDEKEIEHYREVIRSLRTRGIEPFINIWHWPVPIWLAQKGGWQWNGVADKFEIYVEKLVQSLGNDVNFWITINEPEIFAMNSYLRGIWPPQKRNIFTYMKVRKNLIKAHKLAYEAIKSKFPEAQVGIAKNNTFFDSIGVLNTLFVLIARWWNNHSFLNQIKDHQDFIGLNSYFHNRINWGFNKNKNERVSDMGWELYPRAIYHTLRDLKGYKLPIYISEQGLADAEDINREWFIQESLTEIHNAIREGIDVRGYFYWSLLDNFEWDKGFWPRFGLVEINYKTQERKIRPSAYKYAEVCKSNSLKL